MLCLPWAQARSGSCRRCWLAVNGDANTMNMADQKNLISGELREHEPMARHTSWRAGGYADRAYVPANLDDMCRFIAGLPAHESVYVVGLGSNLLVRDGGLRGTVIFTHGVLKAIALDNGAISVEA